MRSQRPDPAVIFAFSLFVVLLALNLATNPATFGTGNLGATIGLAAPMILASMAVTPAFLVGNGGIDLSVGPLMGLTNAVIVMGLVQNDITSPLVVVLVALGIGGVVGLINGLIVSYVRIQPIVATLGTYLSLAGLTIVIAPTPGGNVPPWLSDLATRNSTWIIVATLLVWFLVVRSRPFFDNLMATAGDERAAYTSGVNTARVRVAAFTLSGILGGIAGLGLTAVLGSVDPTLGPRYTLTGLAAAALGGVSVAGGRGGMSRAVLGGLILFLLENLLTYVRVSSFLLQVVFGLVLVVAVSANGLFSRRNKAAEEAI
ncbi:MAG: ABC transporter permease [Acidimicrobiia bacterium]|nr:ABC transporter permease [Acidimicrobiia bacterium]